MIAIILGLANAVIRPLLKLLSCPLIILTLGFFCSCHKWHYLVAGLGDCSPMVSC